MKLTVSVLRNIFRKYLCNRNFLEKYSADGYPDLCLYGIGTGAEKRFDSQVLFDPFEKEFYPPAVLVKLCNGQGRQSEIV